MELKHFKQSEFQNFGQMNCQFLEQFDDVRDRYSPDNSAQWIITSDYRQGQKEGMHGEGRAIDFHILDNLSAFLQAKKIINICEDLWTPSKCYRLGWYPWQYHQGFHLDNKKEQVKHLFWISKSEKKYTYYYTIDDFLNAINNFLNAMV
jgi:hypothetical protein